MSGCCFCPPYVDDAAVELPLVLKKLPHLGCDLWSCSDGLKTGPADFGCWQRWHLFLLGRLVLPQDEHFQLGGSACIADGLSSGGLVGGGSTAVGRGLLGTNTGQALGEGFGGGGDGWWEDCGGSSG